MSEDTYASLYRDSCQEVLAELAYEDPQRLEDVAVEVLGAEVAYPMVDDCGRDWTAFADALLAEAGTRELGDALGVL